MKFSSLKISSEKTAARNLLKTFLTAVLLTALSFVTPESAQAARSRTNSSVIKATNPDFSTQATSNREIAAQTKYEANYHKQLLKWHKQQIKYISKLENKKKRDAEKAKKEAAKRERAYAKMMRAKKAEAKGVKGEETVALSPTDWFTKKIAGRNSEPESKPAAQVATQESGSSEGKDILKLERSGKEIAGVDPKKASKASRTGFWFHVKRALGLVK